MASNRHILTQRDLLLDDLPTVTPLSYADYLKQGGYQGLLTAVDTLTPLGVLDLVKQSGLRGRGGAGFPTSKKWEMVLQQSSDTRYLCCNGAEDEPGTFKDRYLLRSNPHQLIEGALLAAFTIGAKEGYLYLNGGFNEEIAFLEKALLEATDHGYLGRGSKTDIELHIVKSPGTYIAGEETALLEVIEGRPAKPQQKPPYYPVIHGLFGKPTVVNNLETICNLPHIIRANGSKLNGSAGTMVFSLTGDVKRKGLYELPLGTSLRELIETYGGGGWSDGEAAVKAVFPGGPSNAALLGNQLDLPLDFEALKAAGSSLGTGAVIVFSEKSCMVKVATGYAGFFARESCGQCPPCHLGLANLTQILKKIEAGEGKEGDIIEAEQLCGMIKGRGYCHLLTGAVLGVESILDHFKEEFFAHIQESKCSFDSIVNHS